MSDVAPIGVPDEFEMDRGGLVQITEINQANLLQLNEDTEHVAVQLAEAAADGAVLASTPSGWYAYIQQVADADATSGTGGVPFLDRDFLARLSAKVQAIEGTASAGAGRLAALEAAHADEAACVSAARTVASDLEQLRQTLDVCISSVISFPARFPPSNRELVGPPHPSVCKKVGA